MQKELIRLDGKKLELVSDKIFQENFIEVIYNDFSSVCAMICVDSPNDCMIETQKIRDLEYYGFKTTHIKYQNAGLIFFVYQMQDRSKYPTIKGKKI